MCDFNNIEINEESLFAMQDLLQDQFPPTIEFCMSEFDRLANALHEDLEKDITDATRHAHSLKSNAAQFGAVSLANLAKQIEHLLSAGDKAAAEPLIAQLDTHIIATKAALTDKI